MHNVQDYIALYNNVVLTIICEGWLSTIFVFDFGTIPKAQYYIVFLLDFGTIPTVQYYIVFLLDFGTIPTVQYYNVFLLDFETISTAQYYIVFLLDFGTISTVQYYIVFHFIDRIRSLFKCLNMPKELLEALGLLQDRQV
jgi:hypothetical protein